MAEISDESYEELWQILEKKNGRAYTFEETKEIGDGLIDFYNLLMEFTGENTDEPEDAERTNPPTP